ncbi:MAG: hypothetical protein IPK39_24255 [Sulfuritalea sp.]|nr:hypothetical protein [Sulfuritalea sp.]
MTFDSLQATTLATRRLRNAIVASLLAHLLVLGARQHALADQRYACAAAGHFARAAAGRTGTTGAAARRAASADFRAAPVQVGSAGNRGQTTTS